MDLNGCVTLLLWLLLQKNSKKIAKKFAKGNFFIAYLHHNSRKTHAKLKPNGHSRATLTPLAQDEASILQ